MGNFLRIFNYYLFIIEFSKKYFAFKFCKLWFFLFTDPRHYILDPDLAPDSDISITKNHNKKNLDSYYSVISIFIFFYPKTDPDPNLNPNSDIYF